ncbi:MAG: hypothetical protein FWH38_09365, partial [Treponema sp.]|nr:hypothetical protein [Treponema sp.]
MTVSKHILINAFILPAAFLFLAPPSVPAQEGGQPRVLMQGLPERPVSGSTWVLTLLIGHSDPNEVNVLAPPFTGPLLLDQVLKGPRYYNPATGQSYASLPAPPPETESGQAASYELWTAMEYRFQLNSPGTVFFDSFSVTAPQGQVKTAPFNLRVTGPENTAVTKRYGLVWEGAPADLKTGESAVFCLKVSGWNSQAARPDNVLPEVSLFMPPVLPGCILETLSLTSDEKSEGTAIRLRLIPLEASDFALEKRQFAYGGAVFEIPALRIHVSPGTGETGGGNAATDSAPAPDGVIAAAPPFPVLETAARAHS